MLENRRRSQLRLEPIIAMPTTRTTTRRTRRLCFNIETNGAGPLRTRRRRRSPLPDPYFAIYPPAYEPYPWVCGDWGSNEHFYSYGNFVNPFNQRLYGGEEYEEAPGHGFYQPEEEECAQELYANNSCDKPAGDLESIIMSLDGYMQEENSMGPESNGELNSTGLSEERNPQNNQIAVLIDVMCNAIGRLNNFMTAKSQENMDMHNNKLKPLPREPPPVQVLVLPVQPLILPPNMSNSAMNPPNHPFNSNSGMNPSNNPYIMEPESCPYKNKTQFKRLPCLKERKRKRQAKTYVQNQCCGTEDLNMQPRILEPSINRVPMKVYSPQMKDCSTTMWCPMKCTKSLGLPRTREQEANIPSPMTKRCPINCAFDRTQEQAEIPFHMTKRCPIKCGLDRTLEQKRPAVDFEIPISFMKSSSSVRFQEQEKPIEDFKYPSSVRNEQSSEMEISSLMKRCGSDRTQVQKKPSDEFKYPSSMTLGTRFSPSLLRAPPPSMKSEEDADSDHEMNLYHHQRKTSSYCSSCDFPRHAGGNIIYSYVEEEQVQLRPEQEDHVDEDEWYQGASDKLAELELEQEYYNLMQKQGEVITKDQQQQTDFSDSENIIRVTTDKAVSTTDINGSPDQEPVNVVRFFKRSSLKPRHRLTKGSHRVKFEKEPHKEPIEPEVVTIGRCPMDWEETARSINRCCRKSCDSSSNSKEKRNDRD